MLAEEGCQLPGRVGAERNARDEQLPRRVALRRALHVAAYNACVVARGRGTVDAPLTTPSSFFFFSSGGCSAGSLPSVGRENRHLGPFFWPQTHSEDGPTPGTKQRLEESREAATDAAAPRPRPSQRRLYTHLFRQRLPQEQWTMSLSRAAETGTATGLASSVAGFAFFFAFSVGLKSLHSWIQWPDSPQALHW